MTASALLFNLPVISTPFDATATNMIAPAVGQQANGFIPSIDKINAEQQNWLHNAGTTLLYLNQLLGLGMPFNPVAGASIVATPSGGIVSVKDSVTGATQFYVAKNNRPVGYTDPSLDPTNWSLLNLSAIATYITPYADATGTSDAITAVYNSIIYPVLQDGMILNIATITPNLTATPTLQVTLNGSVQTARTIVKIVEGIEVPLSPGDFYGLCTVSYDLPNLRWVLINPNNSIVKPGSLLVWAGPTAPNGYLQCPNTLTNISRTAYSSLFNAIGTTWGAGDGSTTFGLPWLPAGYALLQGLGLGAIGTQTIGQMPAHFHTVNASGFTFRQTAGTDYGNTLVNTSTAGSGTLNLAAGAGFMLCIKY